MNKIDLSGRWLLQTDKSCSGRIPRLYKDEIVLPDTLSHARKGVRNDNREQGFLTDPYSFEGHAWFRREFEVLPEWAGSELYIRLERTRMSVLCIDGKRVGEYDSLCTPHLYKLPGIKAGTHRIDICISNTGYPTKGGHMTSPDTQTNWIGITGGIDLIVRPRVHIDDIRILSETTTDRIVFSCNATGEGEAYITAGESGTKTVKLSKGENTVTYVPDSPLEKWDEFSPKVYRLCVAMNGEMQRKQFGIRTFEAKGRKLLVNGRETFLRGKHDGMLFPMTGYAPTDTESWLEVMKAAKELGINHYRFHTCCPPEAAFNAADMLGIYMQPELPFWGTIEEEENDEIRYLTEEGSRILKAFGNHPSFVMMSLGNELWGSKEMLSRILARYKSEDDRHLYTDGSNNFQFLPCVPENSDFLSGVRLSRERLYRGSYAMCDAPQGFIQTDEPNTAHNYDLMIVPETVGKTSKGGKIKIQYGTGVKEVDAGSAEGFIPDVPVISHEVGQYETYPDYSSAEKFTGALKAENILLYKEKAEQKGLLTFADSFFHASGALAADCYKREIEAALRSKELAGFQLLDIQDFMGQGTALVGVLDAFMQPKGTISAEKWREFCAPTVIMAEFEKFVFSDTENVVFGITLFNTDPSFDARRVSYSIECGGSLEQYGHVMIKGEDRVRRLGKITFSAEGITAPTVYDLTLKIEGTDIQNTYTFRAYPDIDVKISDSEIIHDGRIIRIAHTRDSAHDALEKGIKVLYVPDAAGKLPGTYCTDFWCYPMFRSISESMGKPVPIGTEGLLIDKNSRLLAEFPSDTFTTPQWYHIVTHSHCEDLGDTGISPDVWVIDNPDRADRLGLLYRIDTGFGKVTACTSRLWEIADRPEVKWFAKSLLDAITEG